MQLRTDSHIVHDNCRANILKTEITNVLQMILKYLENKGMEVNDEYEMHKSLFRSILDLDSDADVEMKRAITSNEDPIFGPMSGFKFTTPNMYIDRQSDSDGKQPNDTDSKHDETSLRQYNLDQAMNKEVDTEQARDEHGDNNDARLKDSDNEQPKDNHTNKQRDTDSDHEIDKGTDNDQPRDKDNQNDKPDDDEQNDTNIIPNHEKSVNSDKQPNKEILLTHTTYSGMGRPDKNTVKHDKDENSKKDNTNFSSYKCYVDTFPVCIDMPKENSKTLELSPRFTDTSLGMETIGSILGKEINYEYFTYKLPSSAEFNIHVDSWTALFARKSGKCLPKNEWQQLILPGIEVSNPYCVFNFSRHQVSVSQLRTPKLSGNLFFACGACKFGDCQVKINVVMSHKNIGVMVVSYEGEVKHKTDMAHSRNITSKERQIFFKLFKCGKKPVQEYMRCARFGCPGPSPVM